MGECKSGGRLRIWARDYSDWDLSGEAVPDGFSPANARALDGDVVAPDGTVHRRSGFRGPKQFAGVLAVTGATYGRHDRRRFLYRCVPADARLPVFLVAYDAHRRQTDGMAVGRVVNVYVLFRFSSWRETHPRGELLEVIGPTSSFEAYCEYQVAVSGTRTDTPPLTRTWRKLQSTHPSLRKETRHASPAHRRVSLRRDGGPH